MQLDQPVVCTNFDSRSTLGFGRLEVASNECLRAKFKRFDTIEGIFNDIQRIPALKLRIRVTRHRTSGHSFLRTSRATIGAYFCISLGDSLAAASKGDSQLSRATGRRAFQRFLRGTKRRVCPGKEKYERTTLDFIARVVIFLARPLTGPA